MLTLPRKRMLKRRSDFQRVYHTGHSYANRYFVLYVFFPEKKYEAMAGKVGFAAGKKLGCAVVRNRVKRLMRESWRKHQEALKPGLSMLLVARKGLTDVKSGEAEKAFCRLGAQAGIFVGTEARNQTRQKRVAKR